MRKRIDRKTHNQMNKMKFGFWMLIISLSCSRPKEVIHKKLEGINGYAVYILNKDGSINGVFKEKFYTNDIAILLAKDTISLGNDFQSSIYVIRDKYEIEMNSPTNQVILGDAKFRNQSYTFRPEKEGVYNFTGIIKYDTVASPFDYKFIVVKRLKRD